MTATAAFHLSPGGRGRREAPGEGEPPSPESPARPHPLGFADRPLPTGERCKSGAIYSSSKSPRRLSLRTALVAVLTLAGLVLAGQGLWIHAKAALAQVLLERAFAESLATGRPAKPWSWADTWPVARIAAPRLGESAIALAGASGAALAFGPGHLDGTPEAGEPGVAVYAAHRDTHFAFLGDVRPGDEITVTRIDGRALRFRVTGARVAPWNASGIDPQASGAGLALVTCWPLDAVAHGPLRYVVEAELADAASVTAGISRRPPSPSAAAGP